MKIKELEKEIIELKKIVEELKEKLAIMSDKPRVPTPTQPFNPFVPIQPYLPYNQPYPVNTEPIWIVNNDVTYGGGGNL